MRLKSVYISQYKNLKDFTLNFDGSSFIDVFVGKNGTGKSNLFEALIEIFRHLYESDRKKAELDFDYSISLEIDGAETHIAWISRQFRIGDKERKTTKNTTLPDNVLIYYSGHNDTVVSLVKTYEEAFRKRIKDASFDESRRFIGIGSEYKELLLSVLLMQPNDNKAQQFICQKLGIESIASEAELELKPPFFAKNKLNIDPSDLTTYYWGSVGNTREFLDKLVSCVKGGFSHGDLYSNNRYKIPINIELFQREFADEKVTDIFRQFDNLKTLGMLAKISIPIQLTSGIDASIDHFSDGQFQSVYIYSIIELFKDRNCITLLDEPDSFLHPEWQFGFLNQVFEITDTAAKNNHVLMSSHSAATLCPLEEQNISLFKIDNFNVSCTKRTKKEIINELSNSFIQYSEDESKLLIENVIRSSTRPILFVEGVSDVSILNTAYMKLYPGRDISILIQDAFERGFIKTLFRRNEIFRTYNHKQFFALFDFDDAYEDWRELGGEHKVKDIKLGLCRKLTNKNAYAFLLPIPENQLKEQVWDETIEIEKIKPKPHFCIEHIFWEVPGLNNWFRTETDTEIIRFRGDKVKFATEVVPTIDSSYFEVFRPMFEFIISVSSGTKP